MKKIVCFLLSISIGLIFAGCSANQTSATSSLENTSSVPSAFASESSTVCSEPEAEVSSSPETESSSEPVSSILPISSVQPAAPSSTPSVLKPSVSVSKAPSPQKPSVQTVSKTPTTQKPSATVSKMPSPQKPTATVSKAPTPQKPVTTTPQSQTVWISQTGKKYHSNPDCSNMKNPIKTTLEKAKAAGRTPCKKCY